MFDTSLPFDDADPRGFGVVDNLRFLATTAKPVAQGSAAAWTV